MPDDELRDWDRRDEHQLLAFFASAVLVLGSLLLFASLVSSEEGPEAPGVLPASFVAEQGASSFAAQDGGTVEAPVEESSATDNAPVDTAPSPEAPQAEAEAAPVPARVEPLSPPPSMGARSYAVIERSCGALLYGMNEEDRLPPASVTKIITALVVEREANEADMVDIHVSGSQMARRGSSVMGIEPGMHVSVIDLLYGLFLPSGNDAALALAEYVGGGDVNRFVDLMNDEAARLGMNDTHFTNPHGLDNGDLYSSALDMALAGRAYLDVGLLAQIAATAEYQVDRILLKNGNRLLQAYPGTFGVKIGYTRNARQTIVAAAERGGRQLIISVFGSEDRYKDSIALFDWAFASLPNGCESR
jgi:D-alanyl-D-alanine carboxypeptidase (penicillin-binding protein 5/6)